MSALQGEGVEAWLDCVLGDGPVGQTVLDIDYDRYADGEAALGWLDSGTRIIGGCCGLGVEHIEAIANAAARR